MREMRVGSKFGRLSIVLLCRLSGQSRYRKLFAVAICDCGKPHVARASHIQRGNISSCGCWHDESARVSSLVHGHSKRTIRSPEYRAWCGMKDRCCRVSNKRWEHYGGRGISVCDEWIDNFQAFLDCVGARPAPGMSIDRVDVNRGYEPGNVRWANATTQARNVRNRKLIAAHGASMTLAEWGDATGIPKGTIWERINGLGWTAERAVSEAVNR